LSTREQTYEDNYEDQFVWPEDEDKQDTVEDELPKEYDVMFGDKILGIKEVYDDAQLMHREWAEEKILDLKWTGKWNTSGHVGKMPPDHLCCPIERGLISGGVLEKQRIESGRKLFPASHRTGTIDIFMPPPQLSYSSNTNAVL
jgi:hypothetical protein